MYLAQLFRANPLMAIALLICLATILWCILLTRRQHNGLDKTLTGLLGLIAIYDALRILKDSGVTALVPLQKINGWVELISACLFLVAAFILKTSSIERAAIRVHLRLVEASDKPVDLTSAVTAGVPELRYRMVDAAPLAIFAVDPRGMVTYWNAAAQSLLGWTRNELVGHELPFDPHGPLQSKSGGVVEAAIWTSQMRPPNGPPTGTVIIAAGNKALRQAGVELCELARPQAALHI